MYTYSTVHARTHQRNDQDIIDGLIGRKERKKNYRLCDLFPVLSSTAGQGVWQLNSALR